MKKTHKNLEGTFWERQRQPSDVKCACGCDEFISKRAAKDKAKGRTDGYIKGHFWKGKNLPESTRKKMSENHADFSGSKNPNYGKGLAGRIKSQRTIYRKRKYYRGSNLVGVNTKQDRAFREYIRVRDNASPPCGKKKMLECHHIKSWGAHPELRFDPKNCVTLCKSCYARADNKHHKDRIRPMLWAYIKTINTTF